MDERRLSRVEDAGLNASAPPQQIWMDGWLLRFNPGKAKRARCINAMAEGRQPLADKLRRAAAIYAEHSLPMVLRITPFTQPPGLGQQLAACGYAQLDDTRVMICTALPQRQPPALPTGTQWVALSAADYAQAVGSLRGTPADQRAAHAQRLVHSPVPYQGYAIVRSADQAVLACGQFAREADLVGLYDVYTDPEHQNQGLAAAVCERLLAISSSQGASMAYLQVEADNAPARHLYARLGFRDGYAYHYRQAP